MPYYNFKNKETGEEFEEFFTISGREEYLKDNPHIQQTPSLFAWRRGVERRVPFPRNRGIQPGAPAEDGGLGVPGREEWAARH